jgi:ribonuclease E
MVLESNRDLVLRRLIECLSRDRTKHQVAEVTSLGLVQMTRKKIGLGLLETFSEPCEVCAGRGVVVHHDPVMKHRQTAPAKRSRGGAANKPRQSAPAKPEPANEKAEASSHVNTEGAKSALAKIAASTLEHHEEAVPAAPAPAPSSLDQLAGVLPEGPRGGVQGEQEERVRKPRRRRASDAGGSAAATPQAAANDPADLLASVLNALPEPKAPGQGRSRRRVTTAALTGTAVNVAPTAADDK